MKQKKRMKEGLIPADSVNGLSGNGNSPTGGGTTAGSETALPGSSENSRESNQIRLGGKCMPKKLEMKILYIVLCKVT